MGRSRKLNKVFTSLAVALAVAPHSGAGAQPAQPADIAASATPLTGRGPDLDPLLAAVGEARVVLLGEQTHGTREFYQERARITLRLVREKAFGAVALEADAPDAERVNAYVRGLGSDRSAQEALGDFRRFPRWMWANAEFASFIEELRRENLARPEGERVGVYGLDVYNLYGSMDAVVAGLQANDPALAARVRQHYRCFEPYARNEDRYGRAARRADRSCEAGAKAALELVRGRARAAGGDGSWFGLARHAGAVAGAEAYFRATHAGAYAWNVRDRRMAEAVEELTGQLASTGRPPKVVVWAHNTHVGDARATEMANRGELNLGQLMRQAHGEAAFLTGFLTSRGKVLAAPQWDARGRVYSLRAALPESDAGVLEAAGLSRNLMVLRGAAADALRGARPQRAVGVIYLPAEERSAHYFQAELTRQFDAVLFIEQTGAVTPL